MNAELLASAPLANAIVPYLQAIGWALIHFLWQGSLVAGFSPLFPPFMN